MPHTARYFYEFGPFRFDPQKRRLLRNGEAVPLNAKAVDVLLVLVQHPGRMVERETLMQTVWADAVVEDANLTVAISHVRKALSENGEATEYIETIPRAGYRFVAEVRDVREEVPALVIEKHTVSETVIEEEVFDAPEALTDTVIIATAQSRWLALVGTLLLLLVALGVVLYVRKSDRHVVNAGNTAVSPIRSLAVLAPNALNSDADISSLSLGIADALITRLGGLRRVVVRPTSAIIRYIDAGKDPIDVGRALKVDAVMEGSLQRADGRVRVTMRLIDVRTGVQLWSGNFDESNADIFKLQDRMSAAVADALPLKLTGAERVSLARRQTDNAQAYALYVDGNRIWNRRGLNVASAIPYFQKAIALDPNFVRAYVGLANVHAVTSSASPEAEMLIEKALQLDNTLAEAHATRAFLRMFHHWDWAGAEQGFDRAVALDPNSAPAHHWRGVYLSLRGRFDEAKAEMHRALDLDPQSAIITADIGQLHYFAHEYDQAIDYCQRALALDSESDMTHAYLRDIYLAKGMNHEVLAASLRTRWALEFASDPNMRAIYARSGPKGAALRQLEQKVSSRHGLSAGFIWFMTWHSMVVGDREQTLRWLDRCYQEHLFMLPFVNVDPLFDPLRDDPRFQEICQRIGLRS
ncbi:MAG TPA: winged helix-turn-helix domain-containing protein [Thermoanaerobaculia bacterium]|jgi:DNA-binding winged helix-turn-helix (wHTH) protein/TolB-like protein|nr:winged helix-turn-helix domain-containing protein [Thermoanaerobaculia bacterium]